ncbi:hypothetical protein MycrhN_0929 [Mycolicibacterium rhodesiae NBB3]|uniref:Uncharacterized protein n=1 Tax=Mycolicibacterium rhodesiae (strain NBB3) TaxID=710685 RepID=G8RST6_MYCRN|nr:hypothetical protein [Mycolicibacterium rhodesiae]AEV71558.1 hypothetical protein MycrhN_0929 [Mycolicibacterium rhodesiae NBB3]
MRRQSAAVICLVGMAMAAGITPSASADQNGYNPDYTIYRTAGNVRCVVSAEKAACERMVPGGFAGAPVDAPVASVDSSGKFSWEAAPLGGTGNEITIVNGQPYHSHKWTLLLTIEGTRLSRKGNSHGMNVSIDGTVVTPY